MLITAALIQTHSYSSLLSVSKQHNTILYSYTLTHLAVNLCQLY